MSLAKQGCHTGHPYSSMSLTMVLYACSLVLESADLRARLNNPSRPDALATMLSTCLLQFKL